MRNRLFNVFVALVLGLGVFIGYRLSTMPKFQPYKLVNITGLLYDFLGVVALSEMIASNPKWRKVSVDVIAPVILWLQSLVPFGVMVGGFVAAVVKHSSSWGDVSRFAVSFFGYSLIPLSVLQETVVLPRLAVLKNLESRWRWFALYLLLSGVGMQIVAAFMNLTA
jgi:hypothetical protein